MTDHSDIIEILPSTTHADVLVEWLRAAGQTERAEDFARVVEAEALRAPKGCGPGG